MTRATAQKLDMRKSHALVTLLLDPEKGFTAKRLTFREFAAYATQALGFEVTMPQVQTRVGEFEIPHGEAGLTDHDLNVQALATQVLAHGAEISDLKERVAVLEGWVRETFPTRGLKAVV